LEPRPGRGKGLPDNAAPREARVEPGRFANPPLGRPVPPRSPTFIVAPRLPSAPRGDVGGVDNGSLAGPPFAKRFFLAASARLKSLATLTGGPLIRSGFQPCATAAMSLACAGDLLGMLGIPFARGE